MAHRIRGHSPAMPPSPDADAARGPRLHDRPLVLTLELDPETMRRFRAERQRHFPAGRTAVDAHLTLFHALPGALRPEVESVIAELGELPAPEAEVTGLRSLGRGVAYDVSCAPVERLREGWAQRWASQLTRQDAQRLRLHVTVQNKVEPELARHTLARLQADFTPWRSRVAGVRLWRYDGGPWTHLAEGSFSRRAS